NKEGAGVHQPASNEFEKYNTIFSNLMRGVYLNDHIGGVNGCNLLTLGKSKLRRWLNSRKENLVPS
ncbi:hypothetical protein XENOCAPTIV_017792, partial [Xenoophorus captivus]